MGSLLHCQIPIHVIKLQRPVVFFDLETTGIEIVNDRIIEMCMVKMDTDGSIMQTWKSKFNPEGRLSRPEAIEKHGITDEELLQEDTFSYLAPEIHLFFEDADIGGYNVLRFDLPILCEEFMRAGIPFSYRSKKVIDSYLILAKMEPRKLEDVYTKYTGKILENAHSAEDDILATIEIFNKQNEVYDLPESIEELEKMTTDRSNLIDLAGKYKLDDGKVMVCFGKHQGKTLKEAFATDPNYFDWVKGSDTFSKDMKAVTSLLLRRLKEGNLPG
jgi:DNA polymerase III subunit epsilon